MASKMKTCKTCGHQVAKTAKTCPNCGAKLSLPAWASILIGLVVFFLIVAMFGASSSGKKSDAGSNKSESSAVEVAEDETGGDEAQQEDNTAQVFESDTARAEYRSAQDLGGNMIVSLMVTNYTDRECYFAAENTIMNDEFNIQMLGGAAAQTIDPGKSGAAGYTFGYSVQTTVENYEDVHTIAFDLVQYDAETFDSIGSMPIYVTIQ